MFWHVRKAQKDKKWRPKLLRYETRKWYTTEMVSLGLNIQVSKNRPEIPGEASARHGSDAVSTDVLNGHRLDLVDTRLNHSVGVLDDLSQQRLGPASVVLSVSVLEEQNVTGRHAGSNHPRPHQPFALLGPHQNHLARQQFYVALQRFTQILVGTRVVYQDDLSTTTVCGF